MSLSYNELNDSYKKLNSEGASLPSYNPPPVSLNLKTAPQPTPFQKAGQTVKRTSVAGLGVVGKALSLPSQLTEKVLTLGKTYEERGIPKPIASVARLVLDPLNFITFGESGLAKVGLKGIERFAGEKVAQQAAEFAGKEGTITLSKMAGKEFGELASKAGTKAAERVFAERMAREGVEKFIDKGGVKLSVPFTDIEKTLFRPKIGTRIAPLVSKVVSKIPESIKTPIREGAFTLQKAFQYPLKRAPKGAEMVVDVANAERGGINALKETIVREYQKATLELRKLADDIANGTVKLAEHKNPFIQSVIKARAVLDDLGRRAVAQGHISEEVVKAGESKYLPQLYDLFLQKTPAEAGTLSKRITTEEFARTLPRTESEITNSVAKIKDDLNLGKITSQKAEKQIAIQEAKLSAFKRFQTAGGQVENPIFRLAKGLEGVGGLVTKTDELSNLKRFGKTGLQLGQDVLNKRATVTLEKGIKGTQESELARHTMDLLEQAAATGKSTKNIEQRAAARLVALSEDVVKGDVQYIKLPESKALGELSGMHVPEGINSYLTDGAGKSLSTGIGKWMMLLSNPFYFKQAKTIYTPGAQVRNILSNQILNFLQDPGSFRFFKKAFNVLRDPASKEFQLMEKIGLFEGSLFGNEVQRFYTKLGDLSKLDDVSAFAKFTRGLGEFSNKLGDIRSFAENHAKAQAFLNAISKGASVEDAKNIAEGTIFAYNKVGPAIRILRGTAVPFLTFTTKAVPFIAKQGLKYPRRLAVFVKGEKELANLSGQSALEQKYLPDYMKGMIRIGKDKNGDGIYFNPRYIYPWGSTFSYEDFQPLPGLPFIGKGGQLPGGVSVAPTISEFASQVSGRDLFSGQEFVRKSQTPSQQVRARVEHAAKTFLPQPVGGALLPYLPGAASTTQSQKRKGMGYSQLGALAGLQLQPFNLGEGIDAKSKAIQAIKRETTTEVNKAIKEGRPPEYIRKLRLRGIQRQRELLNQ